jgi:CheY-like chemotaxis protein
LSILVAEDNAINQKLILRVLNKLGYESDLAGNGQEAVNMVAARHYDLILMDIQMPVMDGLKATGEIRQHFGSRPLIYAMTANALDGDKENCLAAGMNGYLSKPIVMEALKDGLMEAFLALETTSITTNALFQSGKQ